MIKQLLILALFLTAAHRCNGDQLSRVSSLESRLAAIKNQTVENTTGVRFASASPSIDGYGFFATADLLCWQLKEGGSDYSLSLSPTHAKAAHSHFDWSFGFRTGAGYHMEHDRWDWYVNFTWFQTQASDSTRSLGVDGLSPLKGFGLPNAANSIRAHWNVHYYVLDLELGRSFFVNRFLSFRPQVGIESAWIYQRRRYWIRTDPDPTTGIFGENIYGKNNFFGIGPRAGIQGTFSFNSHFYLMSALNSSLQWGQFDDHLSETLLSTGSNIAQVDLSSGLHRPLPNVQMTLNFGWESNLCQDQFHLSIQLGYEFQYWWRQNQFLNEQQFTEGSFAHESMDLSLNGATLEMRFDF